MKCTHSCDLILHGSCTACCKCSDKRTLDEVNKIYIDEIGDIDVRTYGLKFPKDMWYCPRCRKGRISSAEYYNRVIKVITNIKKLK